MSFPDEPPSLTAVWRIGEAARRSGVSADNIRYYEREGLLPRAGRAGNAYRLYSAAEVHRLRFIRLCRAMDMSLPEVRSLLDLDWNQRSDCEAARATLDAHLQHVRDRLAELQVLERELQSLRDHCDGSGGPCGIIEALHARADATPAEPGIPRPAGRHV